MQPRSLISFVLASVAGIAACGDDKGAPDAFDNLADAPPGIDAPKGSGSVDKAVVVAGDGLFNAATPGKMSSITAQATPTIVTDVAPSGAVDDDPVLRHFGNELFVVNRGLNNVTLLNDQTYAVIDQISTGSNSDPQDVTIADGKLYVPLYKGTGVAVLTRGSGGGSATTKIIDLGSDDLDGHPDCASAYAIGTDVYVTCQLLTNFIAVGSGEVVVIDSTTDTVRTRFRLQTENPIGLLEATADGNLAVGTTVGFGSGSGCIEKISVGATPTSACIVQNSDLGGYASRYQFANGLVYAAVSNFDGSAGTGKLVSYDLTSVTPISPAGQTIGDLVFCPHGDIVVSDTATPAGLRIYSGSTFQEVTSGPEAVGNPPSSAHGLVCY